MFDFDDDFEADTQGWDCDPFFIHADESDDIDLDPENDTGDWQVLVLDRFMAPLIAAVL
jgi:hypothetical protein